MTELVSAMPAPHSGTNLRECEDQSRFKAQTVPVFRSDLCINNKIPPGTRVSQVED
jgi:hypothetical protein